MSDDGHDDGGFDSEEDLDDEVDIIEDDMNEDEKMEEGNELGGIRRGKFKVPDAERITSRFMTKYERARILGSRAL